MRNKGKSFIYLILIIIFSFSLVACSKSNDESEVEGLSLDAFWVGFIDVGQGDSALINLPDGKKIMIDCGAGSEFATKSIQNFLQKTKVDKIDYLILTHPDDDHVAGALNVINNVSVGQLFTPLVCLQNLFPAYDSVIKLSQEKQIPISTSERKVILKGEDYFVAILSPANVQDRDSSYRDFNMSPNPTETLANDISSVVFIEYKGVSFLFTGDISSKQENKILDNYKSGVYNREFASSNVSVSLEGVDFLKVAHHGSIDSSSENFLKLIKPNNAVISVGGDNIYGHPSTLVLSRLINANEN